MFYSGNTSIAVSGTDVYIGGTEDRIAKYWRNDKAHVFNMSETDVSTSVNIGCIALGANNKVHMTGLSNNNVVYLKEGSTPVILANKGERSSSIAVAGSNVYISGHFNAADVPGSYHYRSILWVNGKKVPSFDGSKDINAQALFVVDK